MQNGPKVEPFISIAPMEGVVDWIMRDLLTSFGGIDRTVTEFVRVTDRVLPEHVFIRYCPELKNQGKTASGVPVFIQLLGGIPEWIAENAKVAEGLGAPGIDLNFGCPAKTVNRHDGGATLLKEPKRLFDVIQAVKKSVTIPVTAKVRLGFENKEKHLDIARACSDAGAESMTVHARTRAEAYQPPAHWEYIARMREVCRIPVLANGEIWTREDYERCAEVTGLRDVALGRGLVGRPDLALQIRQKGLALTWPEIQYSYLRPFFHKSLNDRGSAFAVARVKQLLRFLSRGFPEAAAIFQIIKTFSSSEEMGYYLDQEDVSWPVLKSTPGQTAPTASAPSPC